MYKKLLTIFILMAFLLTSAMECFARGGFGGGRSSSFSSSRSSYSLFSSSRSYASSISKPSSSWSFSKSIPVVKPLSFTKHSTRTTPSLKTPYRPSKSIHTTPTRHKTKVVNHYYHGGSSGITDFMTTALFVNMLSDNNPIDVENLKKTIAKRVDTMRNQALTCYDKKGGRACIEKYVR